MPHERWYGLPWPHLDPNRLSKHNHFDKHTYIHALISMYAHIHTRGYAHYTHVHAHTQAHTYIQYCKCGSVNPEKYVQ